MWKSLDGNCPLELRYPNVSSENLRNGRGQESKGSRLKLGKREQKTLKIQRDAGQRVLASETFWPLCKDKPLPKPTCTSVKIKTLQK